MGPFVPRIDSLRQEGNTMPVPFRCSGCSASYEVADDLLGKKIACRECNRRAVVSAPPPMTTFACPTCGKQAEVPASLVGQQIMCLSCQTIGRVAPPSEAPPPTAPAPSASFRGSASQADAVSQALSAAEDEVQASRRTALIVGGFMALGAVAAVVWPHVEAALPKRKQARPERPPGEPGQPGPPGRRPGGRGRGGKGGKGRGGAPPPQT
jgi:DNA-directed RNA polymerase subunit RPC12/RpoP